MIGNRINDYILYYILRSHLEKDQPGSPNIHINWSAPHRTHEHTNMKRRYSSGTDITNAKKKYWRCIRNESIASTSSYYK